jgi:3-deoxy-D-manno-octulosonic-acid transferase
MTGRMAGEKGTERTLPVRVGWVDSRPVSRVVVVSRDPRVAARRAEMLRGAGFLVELCGGPAQEPCPVLGSLPCPLVDRADVLVYDAAVAGDGAASEQLVAEVRETYPDLPVVLTSVERGRDWVKTDGPHRVTPLAGDPSLEELVAAVQAALGDQGMAV